MSSFFRSALFPLCLIVLVVWIASLIVRMWA